MKKNSQFRVAVALLAGLYVLLYHPLIRAALTRALS